MRLPVAIAVTLLLALAVLAGQAAPAYAEGETLTVTKTGMGTVTSNPTGINCGDDCSEPYPSSEGEEICVNRVCHTPPTAYQSVTLTASPASGWTFQGWSANCSGTATTCTVTVNEANETVQATFIQRPPNDNFANAQALSGTNASVNGTTKDATRETGEPHHNAGWAGEHTIWYSWTAPHTGDWNLDTCQANIDSILAVYTGSELGSLTKVKDDNNGCSSGFGSKLTFRATAGTTYRLVVGDAGGATQNTFTLALAAIPAPSNDNIANAQLINGAGASVNGTNVSATREYGEPWGGTGERSVWYAWTAPFTGSATLDTCTANYDSLLSVSMSRWWGLEQVAIANNGCPSGSFGDKLTFNAQKGQTYHIGVDGCCGAPAGTFSLGLNLVDDVAPETTIQRGPQDGATVSNDDPVTFAFEADEPDSSFQCRVYLSDLNAPAWGNCSDGGMHTVSHFVEGTYTFEVRATDTANNTDASPAKRTFTVVEDMEGPTVQTWKPTGRKVSPTAKPTVTFSEAMDETSVEASAEGKPLNFTLQKGTNVVPASVNYSEVNGTFRAVLTPDKPLKRGATYKVTLTNGAEDSAGNALVSKSWSFRVKP